MDNWGCTRYTNLKVVWGIRGYYKYCDDHYVVSTVMLYWYYIDHHIAQHMQQPPPGAGIGTEDCTTNEGWEYIFVILPPPRLSPKNLLLCTSPHGDILPAYSPSSSLSLSPRHLISLPHTTHPQCPKNTPPTTLPQHPTACRTTPTRTGPRSPTSLSVAGSKTASPNATTVGSLSPAPPKSPAY
jgi:hypothetical protein